MPADIERHSPAGVLTDFPDLAKQQTKKALNIGAGLMAGIIIGIILDNIIAGIGIGIALGIALSLENKNNTSDRR